ncbi:MAG: glycosyltransferase family 2 protein [Prevotella sp.]|jgi:glycosyltransferase involved in cell wall biosynthesis|nr:glycosyltransferase family 2 protein [Prevotella sp.]MCI1474135.1 glycosyltransferase family 2 protein [Prevotella sp.]MCI1549787.1 glycosyltransferase family 2 protein [Prevotella sp.]
MIKVSLVISTYNWKEALYLSLLSVSRQTLLPYEVIIADDGSRQDTTEMINQIKPHLPFRLKHIWQEDKGFRKTIVLNKAFAVCEGNYIVQIDGDIILNRHFIADHVSEARPGYYVHGSRGKFSQALTDKFLREKDYHFSFFSEGVHRKLNILRCPLLTIFFYYYKKNKKERGCNMAFWKKDVFSVNGYDERIIGYGFEDIDLPARLRRLGIKKRLVKFKAIEYHLEHPAANSKRDMSANQKIFDSNNTIGLIRVSKGISQYL